MNRNKLLVAFLLGLLFLAACGPAAVEEPASEPAAEGDATEVIVYASPT